MVAVLPSHHVRPGQPLDPIELVSLTRFYADEIGSGVYPFIEYDATERWHMRLYRDHRVDVWLISWLTAQGTQLHDHGGSAGAFTVITGELTESVYQRSRRGGGRLRTGLRQAGHSVGFGPQHVHDVVNVAASPAVSVHAYSRPLTSMTFYDLAEGELEWIASLDTEDPEPVFDLR